MFNKLFGKKNETNKQMSVEEYTLKMLWDHEQRLNIMMDTQKSLEERISKLEDLVKTKGEA